MADEPKGADITAGELASWRPGRAREAIDAFVARVTDESGSDFVPPAERVAVFDNDGTLWCEKPMPVELGFILERLAEMAEADPSPARPPALEGRLREGLRVARRRHHQALPRRRHAT